ncbi:hypothetical protein M501DRAFT_973176 [Patellaria atrata CBS 101060]|uniref:Uncharacterized protein n=1 Tax=Patellaria atrata CBS 101060 TaxID=1346257 RepID=A0A9P4VRP5_9PEZI|nr:hypothetical protein M501DRAFT_973176 [Patellaria atrata CBS 101060]
MAAAVEIATPYHTSRDFVDAAQSITEQEDLRYASGNLSYLYNTYLLDHNHVTTDFNALKFSAAASQQLVTNETLTPGVKLSSKLIISPYNEPESLLDLDTLNLPNQLLAKAFTYLQPVLKDYATADYAESLNWDDIFRKLREFAAAEDYTWKEQSFYLVIFRSHLKSNIDNDLLFNLDHHSVKEACASGGLLKYWFGTKDQEHRNLATCVWRNREDAHKGGTGPWHRRARLAARELYQDIKFSTHTLTISDDVQSWSIEGIGGRSVPE